MTTTLRRSKRFVIKARTFRRERSILDAAVERSMLGRVVFVPGRVRSSFLSLTPGPTFVAKPRQLARFSKGALH
jgi:hypothetical protein